MVGRDTVEGKESPCAGCAFPLGGSYRVRLTPSIRGKGMVVLTPNRTKITQNIDPKKIPDLNNS